MECYMQYSQRTKYRKIRTRVQDHLDEISESHDTTLNRSDLSQDSNVSDQNVDELKVISTQWFTPSQDEDECFYPPTSNQTKIRRMISEAAPPTASWKKYKVRTLCKTATYSKALEKVRKSLETSNLETEEELCQPSTSKKRRTFPNRRYLDTDSRESMCNDSDSDQQESAVPESDGEASPPQPPVSLQGATRERAPRPATTPTRTMERVSTPTPQRETPASSSPLSGSYLNEDVDELSVHRAINKQFRILEELKENQRIMMNMLQGVLRAVNSSSSVAKMPEGASFPIRTMDRFNAMEQKLDDPTFFNGVVLVAGDVGGRTLSECIKRLMRFLMVNDVCLQFNFIGRNGKRAFGGTTLYEVVYQAVKRNAMTKTANKAEVERAVGKWLSGGRDRDGNRMKRAAREQLNRNSNL